MNPETQILSPNKSKKETRQLVYEKLAIALQEYKGFLKEKRFEGNLKKASRMFAADIAKGLKKNVPKAKKKKTKIKKDIVKATNGVS